jgi:hypothetical protein
MLTFDLLANLTRPDYEADVSSWTGSQIIETDNATCVLTISTPADHPVPFRHETGQYTRLKLLNNTVNSALSLSDGIRGLILPITNCLPRTRAIAPFERDDDTTVQATPYSSQAPRHPYPLAEEAIPSIPIHPEVRRSASDIS